MDNTKLRFCPDAPLRTVSAALRSRTNRNGRRSGETFPHVGDVFQLLGAWMRFSMVASIRGRPPRINHYLFDSLFPQRP
jgi:hypothetical protein